MRTIRIGMLTSAALLAEPPPAPIESFTEVVPDPDDRLRSWQYDSNAWYAPFAGAIHAGGDTFYYFTLASGTTSRTLRVWHTNNRGATWAQVATLVVRYLDWCYLPHVHDGKIWICHNTSDTEGLIANLDLSDHTWGTPSPAATNPEGSGTLFFRNRMMVRPDGTFVVVGADVIQNEGDTSSRRVSVRRYDPDANEWLSTHVFRADNLEAVDDDPLGSCLDDTGRVHIIYRGHGNTSVGRHVCYTTSNEFGNSSIVSSQHWVRLQTDPIVYGQQIIYPFADDLQYLRYAYATNEDNPSWNVAVLHEAGTWWASYPAVFVREGYLYFLRITEFFRHRSAGSPWDLVSTVTHTPEPDSLASQKGLAHDSDNDRYVRLVQNNTRFYQSDPVALPAEVDEPDSGE